ncbi:MAG: leucine-rich repeat domain-containing protein, partial [Treponema sp.]|nr:leucine-rich repeat domain-containing protein [Treponema sp.]
MKTNKNFVIGVFVVIVVLAFLACPEPDNHMCEWGGWKETTAPTCTMAGVETGACTHSNCDNTTTRPGDPALDHDWGEWTINDGYSIEDGGSEEQICLRCGETNPRVLLSIIKLLETQEGTVTNPAELTIRIDLGDMGAGSAWQQLLAALDTWEGEYVSLDLSACTLEEGKFTTRDVWNNIPKGMEKIISIILPQTTISIGNGAFYGCINLINVTIPFGVEIIPARAFQDCKKLTNIIIPDSVTSIGNYAFSSCTGLTSITIGNSVTSIGSGAFSSCTGLTSITIGNSVTSIGNYAFSSCTGLTSITIGNSVTSIGNYAFSETGITSITIPDSVTSIGVGSFTGLISIHISNNHPNFTIQDGILYNKEKTEIVLIFDIKSGNINIPNSVT